MELWGYPMPEKSTTFNALTATPQHKRQTFRFVPSNLPGRAAVPDHRLDLLAEAENHKILAPTQLEFVDIARLVKGASKGEGWVTNSYRTSVGLMVSIHVLRCFKMKCHPC